MGKDLIKNTALYTILGFLPLGFATIFTPIYLKYLDNTQYGILNLFLLYSSLIVHIYSFGISSYFHFHYWDLYKNKLELKKLMSSIISLLLIFQVFFGGIGLLFGEKIVPFIAKNDENFSFNPFFIIALVYSAFMVFYELFLSYLRNENKLKQYTILSAGSLVLITIFSIVGVIIFDLKALGAVLGRTVGYGVVIVIFLIYFLIKFGLSFDKKYTKSILVFSLPLFVSNIIGAFGYTLDRILVERLDTIENLGIYALAIVFISIIEIWFSSINNALSPTLFKLIHESIIEKINEIQALSHIILFSVILAIASLIAFIYPLMELFVPTSFHESAKYVPILGMAFIFRALTTITSYTFYSKKKKSIILLNQSTNAILTISFGYLLYQYFEIMGIVYSVFIVKVCEFILMRQLSNKVQYLDIKLKKLILLTLFLTIASSISTFCSSTSYRYLLFLLPLITLLIICPLLFKNEFKNVIHFFKNREQLLS